MHNMDTGEPVLELLDLAYFFFLIFLVYFCLFSFYQTNDFLVPTFFLCFLFVCFLFVFLMSESCVYMWLPT